MFTGADYFTRHPQEDSTIDLSQASADKINSVVQRGALTNHQRRDAAITQSDGLCWQTANPQFKRTAENVKLMNHQLASWGIEYPTYADFQRAFDALKDSRLLDIDPRQQAPTKFVGAFSKQTFYDISEMIGVERQAALRQVPTATAEEIAFDNLPLEQVQDLLKKLEQDELQKSNSAMTGRAGDAWVTTKPEYRDTEHNGLLMRQQLATNGVLETAASVTDYETAYQQLRAAGMLDLKASEVRKQHQSALHQEAIAELQNSVAPSEDELYEMPLEELRRRANRGR